MAFSNPIGKYRLLYYGKRSNDTISMARIWLYNDSDEYIGSVDFYRDAQAIPNSRSIETSDPKRAYLGMHERQIDTVVDMLRNEKPCRVSYFNPTYALIYTGKEPVGEEESEV